MASGNPVEWRRIDLQPSIKQGNAIWLPKREGAMNVIVLTPIRILGEGLEVCWGRHPEINLLATVPDLLALRAAIRAHSPDLVLIDVTHGVDLEQVRLIAEEWPGLALVALGLREQRQDVI